MNPAELVQHVSNILDAYRQVAPGLYSLEVRGGKIGLYAWHLREDINHQIATLNSIDINEGLTLRKWDQIQDRIAILQKEGILK